MWPSVDALTGRCPHLFPGCNLQLCCIFDATNTVFFPVVLSMNVVPKGSQLKAAAVAYLLMWCGSQPTPTHQYAPLLWWWARECPHPPTDWKVWIASIVTLWIFQFCWQCTEGASSMSEKAKKKSRFHDCYWLEQRTGWQQWLHFPFWLAKEWIYKLKQEQKDVSFNTTGEHKSGSDSVVLIVKF